MDLTILLVALVEKFPVLAIILGILGALVVMGQAIVPLTPTTKDDEAWAKIQAIPILGSVIQALIAFAPIQKK